MFVPADDRRPPVPPQWRITPAVRWIGRAGLIAARAALAEAIERRAA